MAGTTSAMLLAPLVGAFDTARSFDSVVRAMLAARGLMLVFAALTVVLTWKLADLAFGREAAWIAPALLSVSMVFVGRSLEVRPDVPAVACRVASLAALGLATRSVRLPAARRYWKLSGILLGLALVFTQKLLLAGPGLAIASILYVVGGRSRTEIRSGAQRLATLLGGFVIPLGVVSLYFAWREALRPLVGAV